jgi:ABC-type transport system substrate-binding protein
LAAAKALLAEAGHARGAGLPPLVLQLPNREVGVYDAAVASWNEIGIPVTTRLVSRAQHWERIERGEAAFFRWGVVTGAEPAESVYSLFWSRAPYREFGYKNPEYDATFESLLEAADPTRRRELAARLESLLDRDLPVIPLRRDVAAWSEFAQDWVHGYSASVNPAGLRFFKVVKLGKRPP